MKFRSVAIKLFIFTAFTGAVTIGLASVIGNFALFRNRYPVVAVFDDVTGLLNGDPVTLAGVTVGKVTGAHVENGLAIVDLSIDSGVRLPKTTTVEIKYRNLLGLRIVSVDPGTGSAPYLNPHDRIPRGCDAVRGIASGQRDPPGVRLPQRFSESTRPPRPSSTPAGLPGR